MTSPENPYAPPQADLGEPREASQTQYSLFPQAAPVSHGWHWLREAFRLVFRQPGVWIINSVLLFVIQVPIQFVPVAGAIVASVLYPVFTGGIVLGAKATQESRGARVTHLFAGFGAKLKPLAAVGGLYLVAMLAICLAFLLPVFGGGLFGRFGVPTDPFGMGEGLASLGLVFGLLLAIVVILLFMSLWFAPALVVLGGAKPLEAMAISLRACLRNIPPFLLYMVLVLLFTALAIVSLGLGLLIVLPAMLLASYTSFHDVFGRPG